MTSGVGTFSATLKTAGNQTITATDTSNSSITGISHGIAVSPLASSDWIVTGTDAGTYSEVKLFDGRTGQTLLDFYAYPSYFTGGVRVALGDVDGDGTPDIITAPAPAGVRRSRSSVGRPAHCCTTSTPPSSSIPLSPVESSSPRETSTTMGPPTSSARRQRGTARGPRLRRRHVPGGADSRLLVLGSNFTTGVRVGAADINGDGSADIIVGAGPGRDPIVQVYSGITGAMLRNFYAFPASMQNGLYVAGGDVNHDGKAELFVGTGPGSAEVRIFDGATTSVLRDFFPFGSYTGGVRVGAGDVNGDLQADLLLGQGPGGTPQVLALDAWSMQTLDDFFAYDATNFHNGIYLGGV